MYFRPTILPAVITALGCGETPTPASTSGNPCENNNGGCDPNAICEPIDGLPVCSCENGYVGDAITCAPDPCTIDNGGCDPNAICALADGKPVCTCKNGYVGDGITCAPEDPCAVDNGGCDTNAACTPVDGKPVCTCKTGYVGDGNTCAPEDPCAVDNGGCDTNATCAPVDDKPVCTCKTGYGDGITCAPDPCTIDNGGCDANATCALVSGEPVCTCKYGYEGDGLTCTRIDPCTLDNGGCDVNATCELVDDEPSCTCKQGYTGDGTSCAVDPEFVPLLAIVSPDEGSTFSLAQPATVTVHGTVYDSDLAALKYRIDDGNWNVVTVDGGTFTFLFDLQDEDHTSHIISIVAVDEGVVCNAAAGDCDVEEKCDGMSKECPPDLRARDQGCRAAVDVCDVTENCSGNGPLCPEDTKQQSGTACGEPTCLGSTFTPTPSNSIIALNGLLGVAIHATSSNLVKTFRHNTIARNTAGGMNAPTPRAPPRFPGAFSGIQAAPNSLATVTPTPPPTSQALKTLAAMGRMSPASSSRPPPRTPAFSYRRAPLAETESVATPR